MLPRLIRLTQIVLGVLIFISSSSSFSAPKIIGDVPPPPDFEWGDWGSSGTVPGMDMQVADYEPSYTLLYKCQMQITDQIDRTDASGQTFWSVAVAEFNFNDTVKRVSTNSLKWFHKAVYRTAQKASDTDQELPFSTKGHRTSIQIQRGQQIDDVILHISLKQYLGNLFVTESAQRHFSRSDEDISIEKDLLITSVKGEVLPSTLVRVICHRKL